MIYSILQEFNKTNSTLDKRKVCEKYKNNSLFLRVFLLANDKTRYTFGLTNKNINCNLGSKHSTDFTLSQALDILENKFCTREITGNNAIFNLEGLYERLSVNDAKVLERIINRDLRINFGKSEYNKIVSKEHRCVKPPYTRCAIGTKENVQKNIDFNQIVYSQEKMDGTFRRALVDAGEVEITSRPGIVTEFPIIEEQLKLLNADGYVFIGEMTLKGEKNRKKGNGLINSDDIPHEDVIYTIWDMIPVNEFNKTKTEIKKLEKEGKLSLYVDRLNKLKSTLASVKLENIKLINYKVIKSMREAYEHFQEITKNGGEGTVIKAYDMTHKDGDSKKQLKCKLQFEIDARITGFNEGKKGTKREKTFGSITYATDDGKIIGSVSGFTDSELEDFNSRREELMGVVIEIEGNDLTKSKKSDTYAVSHPRFNRLRDKNQTDTLERAQMSLRNAMEL